MKRNIYTLIFLILIGFFVYYLINKNSYVENINSTSSTSPTTMKVKVALLDTQTETSNKDNIRGCDIFELIEIEVPFSSQPLNIAIGELFSQKDILTADNLNPGNFISSQKELFFDKVIIDNETAKIYLTGKIGPLNGVCDNPRLRIQLEETALQFDNIKNVEFYLNGTKNDLTFSQKD